jgi:hypothetical protein
MKVYAHQLGTNTDNSVEEYLIQAEEFNPWLKDYEYKNIISTMLLVYADEVSRRLFKEIKENMEVLDNEYF